MEQQTLVYDIKSFPKEYLKKRIIWMVEKTIMWLINSGSPQPSPNNPPYMSYPRNYMHPRNSTYIFDVAGSFDVVGGYDIVVLLAVVLFFVILLVMEDGVVLSNILIILLHHQFFVQDGNGDNDVMTSLALVLVLTFKNPHGKCGFFVYNFGVVSG